MPNHTPEGPAVISFFNGKDPNGSLIKKFMNTNTLFLFLLLILFSSDAAGQSLRFRNTDEKDLFEQWDRTKTLDRSITECLLLAEGAEGKVPKGRDWFANLEAELKKVIDDDDAVMKKGERLYTFLHKRVLKKYSFNAEMASMISNGEYNCVTATAIYAQLAASVGLPVIYHATPFHVCPIIEWQGRRVWVEMTHPKDGFDVEFDREALAEMLLENKFVTREEFAEKGAETVYNEFVHGHFQRSSASLLGYHYYNKALLKNEQGKTEESFWSLAKAFRLASKDEIILKVYDAAFTAVSSMKELASPYSGIAAVYVYDRGSDTTVILQTVDAVRMGVENLVEHHRDFVQSDSVIAMTVRMLPPFPAADRHLASLRQYIVVNKALEFNRKGFYREAFAVMSVELRKDSANAKLQDLYVGTGMDYAQKLMNSGSDETALAVVDTMSRRLPSYEKLKEMYSRIIVTGLMISGKYRSNPVKARAALLNAFERDSTNMYVREGLASVHHELAMEQIRKTNWKAARSFVQEGLRFSRENDVLNSDLQLIQKETPKSKKK